MDGWLRSSTRRSNAAPAAVWSRAGKSRGNQPKEIGMIDLDILVILDRSGSMEHAVRDHEGGLRSFVEDQKSLGGDVRLTLVQFDTVNPCDIVFDRLPLADVGPIQLIPRGGTPLLDAMGLAIAHLMARQL